MSSSKGLQWPELALRALLSLLYIGAIYLLSWLAILIILLQWLVLFIRPQRLEPLDGFASQVVGFFSQVLRYVFFLSDDRPFPFNPISNPPGPAGSDAGPAAVRVEVVTERPVAKKVRPARKSASGSKKKQST